MLKYDFRKVESHLAAPNMYVFRSVGQRVLPVLREAFCRMPEEEVLCVSMPEGAVVDYSFLDETVGKLYSEVVSGEHGDRYLVVSAYDENQFANITASFVMRGNWGLVRDHNNLWQLVGAQTRDRKERDEVADTLETLNKRGTLTTSDLAEASGIQLSAASMRLARLHQARLCKRSKNPLDVRQFVYRSLIQEDKL